MRGPCKYGHPFDFTNMRLGAPKKLKRGFARYLECRTCDANVKRIKRRASRIENEKGKKRLSETELAANRILKSMLEVFEGSAKA